MAAHHFLAGIDDQAEFGIGELALLSIIVHNHLVGLIGIKRSPSPLVYDLLDGTRLEVSKRAVGVLNTQELVGLDASLVPLDGCLDDSIRSNLGNLGIERVVNDSTLSHIKGDIAVIGVMGEHKVAVFNALGRSLRNFIKGIERAGHVTLSGP